jgi:hypothetical protein
MKFLGTLCQHRKPSCIFKFRGIADMNSFSTVPCTEVLCDGTQCPVLECCVPVHSAMYWSAVCRYCKYERFQRSAMYWSAVCRYISENLGLYIISYNQETFRDGEYLETTVTPIKGSLPKKLECSRFYFVCWRSGSNCWNSWDPRLHSGYYVYYVNTVWKENSCNISTVKINVMVFKRASTSEQKQLLTTEELNK